MAGLALPRLVVSVVGLVLLSRASGTCSVALIKQASGHKCSQDPVKAKEGEYPNGTFGCYENATVWVTGGCRGTFACNGGAPSVPCVSTSYTALTLCTCSPAVPFTVNHALGSGMVLQRAPASATLWGTAPPGSPISVTVGGNHAVNATSAADGAWAVQLIPLPAGDHGVINVTSASGATLLSDVLFGDVFLCSGQSNMVFSLSQSYNATEHIAAANATRYQSVRLFTAKPSSAGTALSSIPIEQAWTRANAASVGNAKAFSYFSAVCWFAGKSLFDELGGNVPVGLFTSAYGGTRVHQWSSPEALQECNQTGRPAPVQIPELMPSDESDKNDDSCHYNAMIAPILPMRFAGVWWLQGESDVNPYDDPSKMQPQRGGMYYACQITAMVQDWRLKFSSPALPFMWVQLSPWVGHEAQTSDLQLPSLRQSQLAVQALPQTGFASAVDLGDFDPSTNPWGGVHFRNKEPLGPRLRRVADALVYGKGTLWRGPQATEAIFMPGGCGLSMVNVSFEVGSIASGISMHPSSCPVDSKKCGWWEVVDANGTVHNVTAAIFLDSVLVSVPDATCNNTAPSFVRYLWADWPVASLYNSEGLPATPFELPVKVPPPKPEVFMV